MQSILLHLRPLALLLVGLLFSMPSLHGQPAAKHLEYSQNHYQGMRYGLFVPDSYDPQSSYPLIVYLHGSGDTVSWDHQWYQESTQSEDPCFVLTPKCEERDQGWGNTWKDTHSPATAMTLALMDSLLQRYSIDQDRLYVHGTSMGGFGVFSILEKEQGKFAAAYVVCGGSDVKAASKLLSTSLWIFHGTKDDVVQMRYAWDTYQEMVRLGGSLVRFTKYPGVKHNSWENVGREKTLPVWLLSQEKGKKTEAPDQVTGLKVDRYEKGLRLDWTSPSPDASGKQVWYYEVYRNNELLAEIDGDATSYTDPAPDKKNAYHLVAVNYFFQRSQPSAVLTIDY